MPVIGTKRTLGWVVIFCRSDPISMFPERIQLCRIALEVVCKKT